ncbi:retrovirus-related pol polyprotein from transposon 297 [Plakobranchus ocellatus]|uniref:Retrovirus-related pol polyprotein from transposon 297 n=1 Tax=Plakobranchus ocellatus TaxID=259542 RepID=A0AAV4BRB1_9GAST|nr:retrovirus-related pol polyprotein from transposon 297 [Plakobranchus ocellatus]
MEVHAFLGLVGYYKESILNYAAISAPLSDLVRKGQPIPVTCDGARERVYNSLKAAVTCRPVLHLFDTDSWFVLRADASNQGLGEALRASYSLWPTPEKVVS